MRRRRAWLREPPRRGIHTINENSRFRGAQRGATIGFEGIDEQYAKFAVLTVVILGTLLWLASANIQELQTYYKTIQELNQLPDQAKMKRLRVGGDVEKDSIVRKADLVTFTLKQDNMHLKVAYTGRDPLPDTFRNGAQALADGRMGPDGVFQANKIQAKCSSKYAAKPGEAPAGLKAIAPIRKT